MGQLTKDDVKRISGKEPNELTASEWDNVLKEHEDNAQQKSLESLERQENLAFATDVKARLEKSQEDKDAREESVRAQAERDEAEAKDLEEQGKDGEAQALRDQIEKNQQRFQDQIEEQDSKDAEELERLETALKDKQQLRRDNLAKVSEPQVPGLAPDHPIREAEVERERQEKIEKSNQIAAGDIKIVDPDTPTDDLPPLEERQPIPVSHDELGSTNEPGGEPATGDRARAEHGQEPESPQPVTREGAPEDAVLPEEA